jgi:DNA-binding NtrC family response regulator
MSDDYISKELLLVANESENCSLLVGLLEDAGFMVTHNTEPSIIKDLLENKFFFAAIFELDTPKVDYGLALLSQTRKLSPITHTYLITNRESFTAAVGSFRLGCQDAVLFDPSQYPYLISKIRKSALRISFESNRDKLLFDMSDIHKSFFKKMLTLHIKLMESNEALQYKDGQQETDLPPINILLVDGGSEMFDGLSSQLPSDNGWNLTHCTWGSEALDIGGSGAYQIALVNKSLPDLPGSMISSTLKATAPKTVIFIFDNSNGVENSLKMFEGSTSKEIPLQTGNIDAISDKFRDIRRALSSKSQKEVHVKTFKAQNYEFIQKYSKIKAKIKRLNESG